MIIREVNELDLDEILELYLHLHEKKIPEKSEHLQTTWDNILNDEYVHMHLWRMYSNSRRLPKERICYCMFKLCKADCSEALLL